MKTDPGSEGADVSSRVRLRVLIVEDSEDDALLLLRELKRGGYEPASERVDTLEAMRRALAQEDPWDVVLSDWRMPRFSATEALAVLRETDSEAPFVIVSGKVGEVAAVEAMRAGAHDYVMKGNLARLCAIVERGLQEAEARRERRRAEEQRDRLFEFSPDLLGVASLDGHFKRVNPAFEETLGYSSEELLAKPFVEFVHPEDRAATTSELESLGRGARTAYFENRYLRKDGAQVWLEWKAVPVVQEGAIYATARDVTERKRAEEALRRRDAILRAVAFAAERFLKQATPWQESAQEVLERLGAAAEASRVYIFEGQAGADGAPLPTKRHEWLAPGVPAGADHPTTIGSPHPTTDYSRWRQILGRGELLCGHTREFPPEEQPMLEAEGVLSIALVSIFVEGEWWGFIGFDECFAEREWSAAETEALEAAANTLGAAIQRERAEEALRRRDAILRAVAFAAEGFIERMASWQESAQEVLERLGAAAEVSRVYVLENHLGEDGETRFTLRYEWVAPGVTAQIDKPLMASFPYRAAGYGRWVEVLGRGDPIYGHTRDFPQEEQPELEAQDVLSIAVVPIFVEGQWWGQIGFDECTSEREWSVAEVEALKAAADTLGAAIQRERAEEALRRRDAILRAVAFAAERFLKRAASWEESIEEVLERLCRAAEASRVYVFENYTGADGEMWTTQRYERVAPGVSAQIDNPSLRAFPYRAAGFDRWMETLGRGGLVYGHTRTFPEGERRELRGQDIESIMTVPIFVEGEWWGFIGFDECFTEREWSAAEIEALKAAANTLGAAIQRERAEEAIRQSEQLYRTVVEQATEYISLVDIETRRFVGSNPAFREALGYTEEELGRMTLYDIVAHDTGSIDENARQVVEEGRHFLGERQHRRKDGTLVDVEVSASTILHGGRKVACVVGHDVTERKRTEQEIRQSEERYRAVVEQAAEGIFLFDAATGDILESNAALQDLVGHTAAELSGMKIYDLVAHDTGSIDSNIRRVVGEGGHFVGERRYRRKDGSLADVEVSANLISYDGREVICTVIRDVTGRVEAFRMLEERVTALAGISASLTIDRPMEATLEALAASVVEGTAAVAAGVALVDEGRDPPLYLAASNGLPEGYTRGVKASWRAGIRSPFIEAFRTRQPMLIRDFRRFILADPLYAPIHDFAREAPWDKVLIVPLVSRDRALGAINFYYLPEHEPSEDEQIFLGAVADQTAVVVENVRLFTEAQDKAALEERQRLARELHDSVSQALYGIALGSRTARALLGREEPPDRVDEWLEYVLALAEAGLTEMRALIFELRPESLETEGLISALKQQAAALEARHEIPVHTTLVEEPDLPLETKEALYRIAQEALNNTVKHARASRVGLKLEYDKRGIALEVSDDGAGFDPEGDFSGHLGLKSMRERAARLGGTIRVESAPGEGTSIRVRIPPRT